MKTDNLNNGKCLNITHEREKNNFKAECGLNNNLTVMMNVFRLN